MAPQASAQGLLPEWENLDVERVLGQLGGGVVLYPEGFKDAERIGVRKYPQVPLTVRTDGIWAWSEASAYYLSHHGVPPCPELVAHLASDERRQTLTYLELDQIREACDASLASGDHGIRRGYRVLWKGLECCSDRQLPPRRVVRLRHQHPRALAYGFDLERGLLRRTVPGEQIDGSWEYRTEIQVRGSWVDTEGVWDGVYAVQTGDQQAASALGLPMVEPGVWQGSFHPNEVDAIREIRRFRDSIKRGSLPDGTYAEWDPFPR